MKAFGLFLLFLLAFAVTVVWKFPVAGVLPYVDINPIQLGGVSGSVWNGSAQTVVIPQPDDQPNVQIDNVNWKANPATLLSGSAGADVNFNILGGEGEGLVQRNLTGDMQVTDGKLRVPAKELEQFLPLPVAQFAGIIVADIEQLELENNLLKTTRGTLTWRNAEVINAVKLGELSIDIVPEGDLHVATVNNSDGELDVSGKVQLDQAGNFKTDIVLKPLAQTPPQVNGILNMVGQPASDGSYRIRNSGNINEYL